MALIKCPDCKKEISDMAKNCPNCGRPVYVEENISISDLSPNQTTTKKKRGHGCLTTLIIFFILFCIALSSGIKGSERKQNNNSIAINYMDISNEESIQIDTVLNDCGITNVISFEQDEILSNVHSEGEKGYRLAVSDSIDNIILYINQNNTVYSLSYNTYYLYENGNVIATLQDYTVSIDEVNNYQYLCQEKIKEILKSPSTAKFPNYTKWGFKQEKNIFTIQGYVDSQNGFGAEIRSYFQFIIDTDTNTITSLIFDGQELMN